MSDIPWMVDAVLAERLEIMAARAGRAGFLWLSALLNDESLNTPWNDISASTMRSDANGMYACAEATMLIDLPARVNIMTASYEVDVRELPLGGGATYCGIFLPGDAFFAGPTLVLGSVADVPMTLANGIVGRRLGEVVSIGMPGLEARRIVHAAGVEGAEATIRLGADVPDRPALTLRLDEAPRRALNVPRWQVPMKLWERTAEGGAA